MQKSPLKSIKFFFFLRKKKNSPNDVSIALKSEEFVKIVLKEQIP